MKTIKLLDHGHLILVDHMGSDKTVVNAARISYANTDWVAQFTNEKDEKLISYLALHKHISPFYHPHLQFVCKAPISLQRQALKHKVGTAENSSSSRYTEVKEEFYMPEFFKSQSKTNHQGSGENLPDETQKNMRISRKLSYADAWKGYQYELSNGVAREQARDVLPLATYTSWFWTMSLAAVVHFIKLRDEEHAQWEIQQYAKAMRELTEEVFPISVRELLKY